MTRGIFNRSHEDGRLVDRVILNEVRYWLHAMLNHGGVSARQMVFGYNPVDLLSWLSDVANLDFVGNSSISGQFMLQRKPRAMLVRTARSTLRRTLGENQTFGNTD